MEEVLVDGKGGFKTQERVRIRLFFLVDLLMLQLQMIGWFGFHSVGFEPSCVRFLLRQAKLRILRILITLFGLFLHFLSVKRSRIRKERTRRTSFELLLQREYSSQRVIMLLFLENRNLLLLVDGFDSFLHLIAEVQLECLHSVLQICDFVMPKVDEILVVGMSDLLLVEFNFVGQQLCKGGLELCNFRRGKPQFSVGEQNEEVGAAIAVAFELRLEAFPLVVCAVFEQQFAGQTYELLVRIVGRPLVAVLLVGDSTRSGGRAKPRLLHAAQLLQTKRGKESQDGGQFAGGILAGRKWDWGE